MRLLKLFALTAGLVLSATAGADDKYVTIKGQITMKDAPKAEVLNVTADKPVCCKDGDLISNQFLVNPKTNGIQNVVVFLRPDNEEREAVFPADKIDPALKKVAAKQHVIDQPKCQFEPRVLAARDGDTLVVKNSSTIAHNINYKTDFLNFNVTVPAGGKHEVKEALKAERNPALFECNIHPWMGGRLFVFDHPYFAVTDVDGKFEIKNAPVGKYRIVYRHETGFHKGKDGRFGFPIDIKDGGSGTMEIKPFDLELPK